MSDHISDAIRHVRLLLPEIRQHVEGARQLADTAAASLRANTRPNADRDKIASQLPLVNDAAARGEACIRKVERRMDEIEAMGSESEKAAAADEIAEWMRDLAGEVRQLTALIGALDRAAP